MIKKYNLLWVIVILLSLQSCGQIDEKMDLNIDKAVAHFNNKEYEVALVYADSLIEMDSNDYAFWTLKGRVLARLDRYEEGLDALSRAIKLNPKYYVAYGYRAAIYNLQGDRSKALLDIEMALTDDAKNAELLLMKGNTLYRLGNYNEAIIAYQKALKENPNDYTTLVHLGNANKVLGKFDLALQQFETAILLEPNKSFAYDERAFLYAETEKYDLAIQDYNKLIAILPQEKQPVEFIAYAHNNRGFAYFKINEYEIALKDINYSLELLGSNSYAYKNRGLVYLEIKETNKACQDFTKAIELGYTALFGDEVVALIADNCK